MDLQNLHVCLWFQVQLKQTNTLHACSLLRQCGYACQMQSPLHGHLERGASGPKA